MYKILNENNTRNGEDSILINALNHYYNHGIFKKVIGYLSGKTGFSDSHVIFTFWGDLDDYDKTFYDVPFDGIEVDYLDDIKKYNLHDVYHYVNLAAQRYIEMNPNDKDEVDGILCPCSLRLAEAGRRRNPYT